MQGRLISENLGDWRHAPVVQDAVIAYMEQLDCPALLREIYVPLGLPRQVVNRVLGRLHAKGLLTRYKIPIETHRPDRWSRTSKPRGAVRRCFLYSFAEPLEP